MPNTSSTLMSRTFFQLCFAGSFTPLCITLIAMEQPARTGGGRAPLEKRPRQPSYRGRGAKVLFRDVRRFLCEQNEPHGIEKNSQVEPNRHVFDVVEIETHLLELF